MALGDLVQIGTSVVVGLNNLTYGTMLMRVASEEPFSTETPIYDARGALVTLIEQNPGRKIKLEGVPLSADLTAIRALVIGSVITVNSRKYRVTAPVLGFQSAEASGTIEAQSEDSLTAAAGPLA